MRKIEVQGSTIFASAETYAEFVAQAEDLSMPLRDVACAAIRQMFYERLPDDLRAFAQDWHRMHPGVAILDAHGTADRGNWSFFDNAHKRDVRSWLKSVDGAYGSAVILVCGEPIDPTELRTAKSLLYTPSSAVPCRMATSSGSPQHHFRITHPTYGTIDSRVVRDARSTLLSL